LAYAFGFAFGRCFAFWTAFFSVAFFGVAFVFVVALVFFGAGFLVATMILSPFHSLWYLKIRAWHCTL
jgi:hypothetical protein